jgi:hypothetical protein
VLLGDRARFQLFGDTVNTAARMESTGMRGKIQLSQSTADLIVSAGKGNWIRPREEIVSAKGKGSLQTYWLEINRSAGNNAISRSTSVKESLTSGGDISDSSSGDNKEVVMSSMTQVTTKQHRLIDWMSEVLLEYVKQIVSVAPCNQGQEFNFLCRFPR